MLLPKNKTCVTFHTRSTLQRTKRLKTWVIWGKVGGVCLHAAEISNMRDLPRPQPTLLQVWVKEGGVGEEKHSGCQADGMSDSGNNIFAWYKKHTESPWCLGLLKVCDLTALLFELVSAVMTHCSVATYPGVKHSSFWVRNTCTPPTYSKHQKKYFPSYCRLTCSESQRASEGEIFRFKLFILPLPHQW